MKRRILLMVLFAIAVSAGAGATNFASTGQAAPAAESKKTDEKPMCPVMKEEVEDVATAAYSDYKGKRYYFCCPSCKPKFDKNPEKYLNPAPPK